MTMLTESRALAMLDAAHERARSFAWLCDVPRWSSIATRRARTSRLSWRRNGDGAAMVPDGPTAKDHVS
jgi:hypothetical protein